MKRALFAVLWVVLVLTVLMVRAALAQSVNIDLGAAGQAGATGRLIQLTALITVLSLAPSLLVMVTAFTRIVIVLSLLRSALATQGTPPNSVLIGLAMFLTFFVMQPVLDQAWTTGLLPMTEGKVADLEGLRLAAEPFRKIHGRQFAWRRFAALYRFGQFARAHRAGSGTVAGADSRLHGRRIAPRV